MRKILFLLTMLLSFTSLFGQLEIDYHGEHFDYKGALVSVTSKYYKAIYQADSAIIYQLEPFGMVPNMSKAHYNQANQMVLFEEFDAGCGWDSTCLKSSIKYVYKRGKIAQRAKYTEWTPEPIPITYTYKNEGDSIFYEYQKRINYIKFQSIKKRNAIIEIWNRKNKKITYLDSLGYPIKREEYFKKVLKTTTTYQRFEEGKKVAYQIFNTHHTRNSTTHQKVVYNELGLLYAHESYKNGDLYLGSYFKYLFDEKGNCTEIKIYAPNGIERYKVVKIYEYR